MDLDGLRSVTQYEALVALIDDLIAAGVMHRVADGVPARDELTALSTKGRGVQGPLLAVTLGHVKNWAYAQLLESRLVDSPVAARFLNGYITAYLDADTRTGASDPRAQALAARFEPLREQDVLLHIEEALDAVSADLLAGHAQDHDARFANVRASMA